MAKKAPRSLSTGGISNDTGEPLRPDKETDSSSLKPCGEDTRRALVQLFLPGFEDQDVHEESIADGAQST